MPDAALDYIAPVTEYGRVMEYIVGSVLEALAPMITVTLRWSADQCNIDRRSNTSVEDCKGEDTEVAGTASRIQGALRLW